MTTSNALLVVLGAIISALPMYMFGRAKGAKKEIELLSRMNAIVIGMGSVLKGAVASKEIEEDTALGLYSSWLNAYVFGEALVCACGHYAMLNPEGVQVGEVKHRPDQCDTP